MCTRVPRALLRPCKCPVTGSASLSPSASCARKRAGRRSRWPQAGLYTPAPLWLTRSLTLTPRPAQALNATRGSTSNPTEAARVCPCTRTLNGQSVTRRPRRERTAASSDTPHPPPRARQRRPPAPDCALQGVARASVSTFHTLVATFVVFLCRSARNFVWWLNGDISLRWGSAFMRPSHRATYLRCTGLSLLL